MPERPGGFEHRDIDNGFQALASAASLADLRHLIDTLPVLSSPIFHAQLRQYRLTTAKEFDQHPAARANFMATYDAFFTELHNRAYYSQPDAPASSTTPRPETAQPDTEAPPFFLALQRLLNGAIPPVEGPLYNPALDTPAIGAEIARLTRNPVDLPAWSPTPGMLWSAVVAACRNCHRLRLAVHPYFLDLQSPGVLARVKERRLGFPLCAACGSLRVIPVRLWIAEYPAPGDPLAALSALVRLSDSETVFLPPPATVRNPDNDRILEIRLDMLMRQLHLDPLSSTSQAARVQTNGIAYSLDELLWRIEQVAGQAQGVTAYEDIVSDVSHKVASGILGWREAERQITRTVASAGQDWPLIQADAGGDLIQALVRNLICEACAAARSLPLDFRASCAGLVAQCYTGIGEIALARIALARARDLVANLTDHAERAHSEIGLDNVEADILNAEGHHELAAALRNRVLASDNPNPDSPAARLAREQLLQNQALELRRAGHLASAIKSMHASLPVFESLASAEPPSPEARRGVSGTLANLAAAYLDCAQNLDLLAAVKSPGFTFEALSIELRTTFRNLGSPQALLAMQQELIGAVLPLLAPEFPGGVTSPSLLDKSAELIGKALSVAREIQDFEYLAIQSHLLARLSQYRRRLAEADSAERDSLRYAARIGQYRGIASSAWFLASAALDRADGAAAIDYLQQCLRAEMRELIRTGGPSHSKPELIAAMALRAAQTGGDPLSAIAIAESSKAISTAVSLARGVPLQSPAGSADLLAKLTNLSSQRETLRLRSIWEPTADISSAAASLNSEIDEVRRQLALRDPRSARWHDATYLDLSDQRAVRHVLNDLGPRATYLGYFIDRGTLYTYAVWAESHFLESHPFPADSRPQADWLPSAPDLLAPLAARLNHLTPNDRLIVSLCPGIDTIPFALLPSNGRPLCELVTISFIGGFGMLESCAARPQTPLKKAVAIGSPTRLDLPALLNAAVETENVAATLEAAGILVQPVLTGNAATVPALIARAHDADLIHFACHASAPDQASGAQLMLAPSPLAADSGVLSEDRIISELVLQPGCHVNLSACSTGTPGTDGEYFTRGLVSTFLVAGASSVLATLWPLADAPASIFQSAYYRSLTQGLSPAFALAHTQRRAIAGELGPELQLPSNVAAYALHGLG